MAVGIGSHVRKNPLKAASFQAGNQPQPGPPLFGVVIDGVGPLWDILWDDGSQQDDVPETAFEEVTSWPQFEPAVVDYVTLQPYLRGVIVGSYIGASTSRAYIVRGLNFEGFLVDLWSNFVEVSPQP